jgi:hypothetical protein
MNTGQIVGGIGQMLSGYSQGGRGANDPLARLRQLQEQAQQERQRTAQAEQQRNQSLQAGGAGAYTAGRAAGPAQDPSPALNYLRRVRSQEDFNQAYQGLQTQLATLRSLGGGRY